MSHFRPVPLEFATRLINHGPTIMVTSRSRDGEKKNIMTAAWSTLVEFRPSPSGRRVKQGFLYTGTS